jgi:hypothetical protein
MKPAFHHEGTKERRNEGAKSQECIGYAYQERMRLSLCDGCSRLSCTGGSRAAPPEDSMIYKHAAILILCLLLAACTTPAPQQPTAALPTVAATQPPISPPTSQPSPEPAPTSAPAPTSPENATTVPPTAEPPTPVPATELPTVTLVPLQVNSFPQGDSFGDELQFQTLANDPSVGSNNGDGIDNVVFRIYDSQGNIVHERTERNALYCAFGGGDDLQNCEVWRFSENNNAWPAGAPLENGGAYRLDVTVNALNGQSARQELAFVVQI